MVILSVMVEKVEIEGSRQRLLSYQKIQIIKRRKQFPAAFTSRRTCMPPTQTHSFQLTEK